MQTESKRHINTLVPPVSPDNMLAVYYVVQAVNSDEGILKNEFMKDVATGGGTEEGRSGRQHDILVFLRFG